MQLHLSVKIIKTIPKNQEVEYLGEVYYAVYQDLLSAIDHLDYHPSMHLLILNLRHHMTLAITIKG